MFCHQDVSEESQQDPLQSRTGQSTTPLPRSFDSDTHFLDKNAVGRLQLPRRVVSTPWSMHQGLQGYTIDKIPLTKVISQALEHHYVRRIANVLPTYFTAHKSQQEAQLLHHVSLLLRDIDINKWLNDLATKHRQDHPLQSATSDRDKVIRAAATRIVRAVTTEMAIE